jgi:hypothetical protein
VPALAWINHHAFIGNSRSDLDAQNLRIFAVD